VGDLDSQFQKFWDVDHSFQTLVQEELKSLSANPVAAKGKGQTSKSLAMKRRNHKHLFDSSSISQEAMIKVLRKQYPFIQNNYSEVEPIVTHCLQQYLPKIREFEIKV
jgi:hypothetical protein